MRIDDELSARLAALERRPRDVFENGDLWAIEPRAVESLLAGGSANLYSSNLPSSAAVIPIGGILDRAAYSRIRAGVERAADDYSVKQISLFIDSPGGSVMGLQETADAIHAASQEKPVRAVIDGLGASAAYWLASQASSIVASPSSELGSVGVIDLHVNLSKMLEKSGVEITALTGGKHKGEFLPFNPLSDDARAYAQTRVDEAYADFLSAVHRGRGARVPIGSKFGEGRLLSAKDALQVGMIDFVATSGRRAQ